MHFLLVIELFYSCLRNESKLTSSMHCVCWSLLAASRAVSPAELTVGQSERRVVHPVCELWRVKRKGSELKVYPSVAPLWL